MKKVFVFTALFLFAVLVPMARADNLSISGLITQSTQDGTGPAANNPSLNGIADGDAWKLALSFDGAITFSGIYNNLANAKLTFSDADAGATESDFGSVSLSIVDVAGIYQFSLLGCLNTGDSCWTGNQISASFEIAAADLNALNAPATGLDQPHPLDLLEDDGSMDIQGSIYAYSYTRSSSPVPEASSLAFLAMGLTLLCAGKWKSLHVSTASIQRGSGI